MQIGWRVYLESFVISVGVTVLVIAVASMPSCSAVGIVLLPGNLLAGIVFPQGVHSNSGTTLYLVLSGFLTAVLLTFPAFWLLKLIKRRTESDRTKERSI
jgi:hypothetical protein